MPSGFNFNTKIQLVRKVIEVTLDEYDRGSLVAGAGGQVTEGADQVGQLTRGGSFGFHLADQAAVLLLDSTGNRFLQSIAGEICEVIVRKVFQLQFINIWVLCLKILFTGMLKCKMNLLKTH